MAGKTSAGILLYRVESGAIEVLLVHPGGPFWKKRDDGAWSIPKGEFVAGEDPLEAAKREFFEETGATPHGDCRALTPLRQTGGKVIYAWTVAGELDPATIVSNTFDMEWPPKSGRLQSFPEIDRGAWFTLPLAAVKLLPGQLPWLDELRRLLR